MPEYEVKEEEKAKKTLEMVEFCTNLPTTEVDEERGSSNSSLEIISSVELETDPNLQEIPTISSDVNIESGRPYQVKCDGS
ncbi:unnamed protein product [Rodentolepis nana]|uniref:Ovule protein n=1 Tax=Rodentolepis nana TaxID=102285 RepID=A0A0R3TIA0_RODNA|nr:unnamed protein product [Rodentolepis nana]